MTNKKHEITPQLSLETKDLVADLRQIIDSARARVASTANYELTMMYWHIGERINRDVLANQRAEYGKQIVSTLARQLQALYGTRGFEARSTRRMMQFATANFPISKLCRRCRPNCPGHTLLRFCRYQIHCRVNSISHWRRPKGGVCGHCVRKSTVCCTNARPLPPNQMNSSEKIWLNCAMTMPFHPIWSLRAPTFWNLQVLRGCTMKKESVKKSV